MGEEEEVLLGTVVNDGKADVFANDAEDETEDDSFEFQQKKLDTAQLLANRDQARVALEFLVANGEALSVQAEEAARDSRNPSASYNAAKLFQQLQELNPDQESAGVELGDVKVSLSAVSLIGGAGYILWTLRGSVLVATALSSTPTWQFINPAALLDDREKTLGKYFK